MGFELLYKKLFEVEIAHDYFLNQGNTHFNDLDEDQQGEMYAHYNVHDFLVFEPTLDTKTIMQNHHMRMVTSNKGFFIGVQVNKIDPDDESSDSFEPAYPFGSLLSMKFSIKLKDALFPNYTNIPPHSSSEKIFYFSNRRAVLNGGTYPSLSLSVADYETDRDYNVGTLVYESGTLYEANKNIAEIDNSSFNSGDWTVVDHDLYYVHEQDLTALQSSILNYDFSDAGISNAEFVLKDVQDETVLTKNVSVAEDESLLVEQLDMSNIKEGYYQLEISGDDGFSDSWYFYLHHNFAQSTSLGIIDIHHDAGEDLEDYQLLDPDNDDQLVYPASGSSAKPVFRLAFKNKTSVWRYHFAVEQTVSDPDLGIFLRDGDASEKHKFITNVPQAHTRYAVRLQKFNSSSAKLPVPALKNLKPEQDTNYSEIHI